MAEDTASGSLHSAPEIGESREFSWRSGRDDRSKKPNRENKILISSYINV
jgi:hypothetical protein